MAINTSQLHRSWQQFLIWQTIVEFEIQRVCNHDKETKNQVRRMFVLLCICLLISGNKPFIRGP